MAKTGITIAGKALVASLAFASGTQAFAQNIVRSNYIDPVQIDRAVEAFTGIATGEPGGARNPADRRLRLASCPSPLATRWHGAPGRTVRVSCEDVPGWQVFVGLQAIPRAARVTPAIKRGDRVTVAVRGRGFTIQQPGEATEPGRPGEWIAIRMSQGRKTVSARIERAGLVVIDSP